MSASPPIVLQGCLACERRTYEALPTPGHWIGMEVFGDLVGEIGLVRCKACGLVFVNPRPSAEHLQRFYTGDNYACHETGGSASSGAKADYLFKRLETQMSPLAPRTLLDFGAGGGGFLLEARARAWEVHGYEPGRRGLESCRAAGLEVSDSIDSLPPRHFGLITLHHVFEHLTDPIAILGRLKRLLASNGVLFIEVPNANSLRAALASPFLSRRLNVDERYRAFPIHLTYYNEQNLRRVLSRTGWVVDRAFTVGLGLDELFCSGPDAHGGIPRKTRGASGGRHVRHFLRDMFLGLGLEENLAVFARPEAEVDRSATSR